jgi:hypothetical protein
MIPEGGSYRLTTKKKKKLYIRVRIVIGAQYGCTTHAQHKTHVVRFLCHHMNSALTFFVLCMCHTIWISSYVSCVVHVMCKKFFPLYYG